MSIDFSQFLPAGPVPPDFHSTHDEGPFSRCSDCGAPLGGQDALHLIGKVWRDGDVIFEYALCSGCVIGLYEQYSEESKRNLSEYFAQVAPPRDDGAPQCHRCGQSGEVLANEHSAEAMAMGSTLLGTPIRVCAACTEGAEKVLSKQTRKVFDDFVRRVAPLLPEDVGIPSPVLALP